MIVRPAELRHLDAFAVLGEELHFGRAARRLGISQSALSQRLHDLEDKVGTALIERTTRRVSLTVAGSVFLNEARTILSRVEQAVERTRDSAGLRGETLRVGAGLHCAFSFLPALLKLYRRRYPSVILEVDILQSEETVRALEGGTLDVGLLRPPTENGSLAVKALYREPFLAAIPTEHPLAEKTILTLSDLKGPGLTQISRPDLRDAFTSLNEQLVQEGTSLQKNSAVDSTMSALALVSANGGYSLVPAWASAIPWSGLVFRQVADLDASIGMSVARRADRHAPAIENFVELASKVALQIGPSLATIK